MIVNGVRRGFNLCTKRVYLTKEEKEGKKQNERNDNFVNQIKASIRLKGDKDGAIIPRG
jgi:hypothetical protein